MNLRKNSNITTAALDRLIDKIIVDAYGDDEQLWAFIRHYEVGLRIGEMSLGDDFNGVLHWGNIDNRPFLRCMHG